MPCPTIDKFERPLSSANCINGYKAATTSFLSSLYQQVYRQAYVHIISLFLILPMSCKCRRLVSLLPVNLGLTACIPCEMRIHRNLKFNFSISTYIREITQTLLCRQRTLCQRPRQKERTSDGRTCTFCLQISFSY